MPKEKLKIFKNVFDEYSMRTIYKLANDGYIEYIIGPISTGKEANVFLAKNAQDEYVAIKMYRIETSDFQNMFKYISGDRRFEKTKNLKRDIVTLWAKKELKNLELAESAGILVPKPIVSRKNVLVMGFIGEGEKAAPTAKNCRPKKPEIWLKKVLGYIKALYKKAGMVHGDLSEYNILNWCEKPYVIDFGQGVLLDHPMAQELLKKDIQNIINWFKKMNVSVPDVEKVYKEITK